MKKVFCSKCVYWGWDKYYDCEICKHKNNTKTLNDYHGKEKEYILSPSKRNESNDCRDYMSWKFILITLLSTILCLIVFFYLTFGG